MNISSNWFDPNWVDLITAVGAAVNVGSLALELWKAWGCEPRIGTSQGGEDAGGATDPKGSDDPEL